MAEAAVSKLDALSGERFIAETGMDARIAAIIEPVMEAMGYRLVRVRLSGQNGLTLQIMCERKDGTMTVEDCEEVSRAVSPALDVEDPIDKAYHLEVSSPGIDRPLVSKRDFGEWSGHQAKIETAVQIAGKRKFKGTIGSVTPDGFVLTRDTAPMGEERDIEVPFDAVTDARLVLTDDLIRDALKKDKELRAARKRASKAGETANDNDTPDTGE